MKKTINILMVIVSVILFGFASNNPEKYVVNVEQSSIAWEGHKLFGGKHTGNIKLQSGELQVTNGKITGGKFIIDINSISVTDIEGDRASKLADHLKNTDFFDAANYPTAVFVLKKVDYADANKAAVLGELDLRGAKQEITFLVDVKTEGNTIHALAKDVKVDRTVHGSKYASIRFFDDLGKKIINDVFTLHIDITASK